MKNVYFALCMIVSLVSGSNLQKWYLDKTPYDQFDIDLAKLTAEVDCIEKRAAVVEECSNALEKCAGSLR